MHLAAAQFFSGDYFASRRFDQRWAAQKYRALIFDDDRFIAHRGYIRATGCARTHHTGDLRNVLCAKICLVIKNAAEVFFIGEHFILERQKCTAGIDQINTRQIVLHGHFLRAQMFFHRQRIVRSAFDGGVIGDNHHLLPSHAANPGNHARSGRILPGFSVYAPCGERGEFQERRALIE